MANNKIQSLTVNGVTYDIVDNTSGYIKTFTETDPVFTASAAANITTSDITNWDAKATVQIVRW